MRAHPQIHIHTARLAPQKGESIAPKIGRSSTAMSAPPRPWVTAKDKERKDKEQTDSFSRVGSSSGNFFSVSFRDQTAVHYPPQGSGSFGSHGTAQPNGSEDAATQPHGAGVDRQGAEDETQSAEDTAALRDEANRSTAEKKAKRRERAALQQRVCDQDAQEKQAWKAIKAVRATRPALVKVSPTQSRSAKDTGCFAVFTSWWGGSNTAEGASNSHNMSSRMEIANELKKFKEELAGQQRRVEGMLSPQLLQERRIEDQLAYANSMFQCALSGTLMKDAVTAEDGYSYSKMHLEEWFKRSGGPFSPVLRTRMESKKVVPTIVLRNAISNALTVAKARRASSFSSSFKTHESKKQSSSPGSLSGSTANLIAPHTPTAINFDENDRQTEAENVDVSRNNTLTMPTCDESVTEAGAASALKLHVSSNPPASQVSIGV